jgi:hypothetical protein
MLYAERMDSKRTANSVCLSLKKRRPPRVVLDKSDHATILATTKLWPRSPGLLDMARRSPSVGELESK